MNAVFSQDLADWSWSRPRTDYFALSKVRICTSFFLFLYEVTSSASRSLKLNSPPSILLRRAIIIFPHQRCNSASSHTAARWSARPIFWLIRSPQIRPKPIDHHLYVDEFSLLPMSLIKPPMTHEKKNAIIIVSLIINNCKKQKNKALHRKWSKSFSQVF